MWNRSGLGLCAAVVLGAAVVGCAASQTETEQGAPLARQILQSSDCGLTAPGHLVLTSAEEVRRLASLPGRSMPLEPLSSVDFDREQVVLAALGQQPTGGYGVTLTGARIVGDDLVLTVREQRPGPDRMVTQALTTPCAAIAVTVDGWRAIRVEPEQNNR